MTRPNTYLIRMAVFLVAVLVVTALLSSALIAAFASNPLLNTLIGFVLLIGIGWNLLQVVRLGPEVHWLETFQKQRTRLAALPAPRLLAPMASMLAARQAKSRDGQDRFTLSAPAMRSLLDSLSSRLDEGRELSRYMTGLLIFLGLLGTFWGLLLTVASVSDVISGMSVGSGDLNALFEQLKSGLGRPLRGMGTAFSSSMFGLAGALVLGFLDLTAGQAQNRFFNELEEWLAGLTRLSSGALGGDGDASVPVYVQALLEQTAENMENLQSILVRGEDGRQQANQAILGLTERIGTLSETMRANQQLMLRIAEAQAQLGPALQRLGDRKPEGEDAMRGHLRNIELYLQRLVSESEQGRIQSTQELRNDIRVLTRTIAALSEGQPGLMPRRRRDTSDALNPWPGYVDALSTLLMVIIFVLLVFVLGQAFLSVALTGRDRALDRLNRQVAELTDMLALERGQAGELQAASAGLNRDLVAATQARDGLARDLAALREEQGRTLADRDALRAERDRLSARLADASLQSQSASARNEQLQARVAETAGRSDQAGQEAAVLATSLAEARRQLAQFRTQLAAAQAELDRTVKADRATIDARLADVARLNDQLRGLQALKDELEKQARDAAARATTEEQRRQAVAAQLADEQKLGESARAQVALLSRQMEELRAQLSQVAASLDVAEKSGRDKDAVISNLGSRLNVALASKVEELQRYRSEFFGRLRDVLANRPGIQVVGDRFVFQSEVLFPVGSADMTQAGQDQIRQLATTLKALAGEIPRDINWLLRVDGHADRQPLTRGAFASNWELSAQRAINVVKLLVEEGVPAGRLAATGFGEFQPLDGAETPSSYARNRRIELRLTDR